MNLLGPVTSSSMADFLHFSLFHYIFRFSPENLTFYSENTLFNSLACKRCLNTSLYCFTNTSTLEYGSESLKYYKIHLKFWLPSITTGQATGLDNISAKLLRECPDLIAESLTYIFNQSLLTGIFPDEWKSARVTPLCKNSGKRNDPTNYRPISVIPVVPKYLNG